jgi:hypothetical protein
MTAEREEEGTRPVTRRALGIWETAGAGFIVAAGTALHFVFGWSGAWRPIAWLAAVNESTWEHFKLGFWPALAFALVELVVLRGRVANFWIAKAACVWTMQAVIAGVFYGYKAVLGRNYLWADILIFVAAVAAGQALSFRFLAARPLGRPWRRLAAFGLVLLLAAFALFTYVPPRLFLFIDPRTGLAGLD